MTVRYDAEQLHHQNDDAVVQQHQQQQEEEEAAIAMASSSSNNSSRNRRIALGAGVNLGIQVQFGERLARQPTVGTVFHVVQPQGLCRLLVTGYGADA